MAQRALMCSVCGLVFETEERLRQHEREAHASKETPTDPQREPEARPERGTEEAPKG